ncbi:hypothetical protein ABZ815_46370 [Nonomuraea sp. NPDC047529]|uniref:hypothetical protein n=1 Tax=Nonomuraea sp. NPDC047529 TaxID=3155623 RepID=UPI0033E01558
MTAVAVAVPLVWLAWLVLIDWVPMFPLNDLSGANVKGRALAAVINYPFPLLIAAGVALHRTWSLAAATVLCLLVMTGHVRSWWLPYFGTATDEQRELYRREYSRTWKVLPTAGRAVVIDVQHMVMGVLSLLMLATTIVVTLTA